MKLRRLRVPSVADNVLSLSSASAHYVRDVLRLSAGNEVEAFDGHGAAVRAVLEKVETQTVELRVVERFSGQLLTPLVIAMATPKGDRADLAVEKLTELGVTRLVWLVCARSIVVPREDGKRLARWHRIGEAAAGQSGRRDVPEIIAPVPLTTALSDLGGGFIAHPDGVSIVTALREAPAAPLTCFIGPEGGFTDDELASATRAGYIRVALGRTILRSETAAIAAAVVMGAREP